MTDEEDEIVLTLATELGKFTDFVGGPEHAHHLFLPLEVLCGFDEPLVRLQVHKKLHFSGVKYLYVGYSIDRKYCGCS